MWRLLEDPTKEDISEVRRLRKARLYADEDIEDWVIEALKERGVNIRSARELGHTGKPDSFHAAHAFKEKRFVLTKNAKHYFDDRKIPFNRTHGVLVLDADAEKIADVVAALRNLLDIVIPVGEVCIGAKIKISSEEISTRTMHNKTRLKFIGNKCYEWVGKNEV